MRKILCAIGLALCVVTQSVSADESTSEWSDAQKTAGMIIVTEGLIGLNAYMASLSPHVYGFVGVVLFPLGMVGGTEPSDSQMKARWVFLASVEALSIHNMQVDKNNTSKSEIIRSNFIGWHAAAGLAAATGYFIDKNKRFALNYMPEPQGGKLMVSYRFE